MLAALAAAPAAPLLALFLAAFARNKVQGFALMKAAGVVIWPPVAAVFVPMPWQLLFGVSPVYWPARVYCSGTHMIDHDMENHDQVIMNVEFPDGHTMVVAGATNNEQGLNDMIRGQQGTLYFAGKDVDLRPENQFVDDVEPEKVSCPQVQDQDELRKNWLKCMVSREEPFSPVEFATKVMVAVDLATRSAWDGKAYGFDKATMSVTEA